VVWQARFADDAVQRGGDAVAVLGDGRQVQHHMQPVVRLVAALHVQAQQLFATDSECQPEALFAQPHTTQLKPKPPPRAARAVSRRQHVANEVGARPLVQQGDVQLANFKHSVDVQAARAFALLGVALLAGGARRVSSGDLFAALSQCAADAVLGQHSLLFSRKRSCRFLFASFAFVLAMGMRLLLVLLLLTDDFGHRRPKLFDVQFLLLFSAGRVGRRLNFG
jgi:hypothetical protein